MKSSSENVSRPRLSVAMIVRNEQQVLAQSIESVRAVADEIVVLDTGSTDRTLEIARKLGARTARMPWADDFAAARNRCMEQLSGDWVLWLNAGERLEVQTAGQLRDFVDRQADPAKVYVLMLRVKSADPAASDEQVARPRLVPGRAELRFEGRISATLGPSIEACGLQVDAAPGILICHARVRDPAWKTLRAQRDLDLAALEMADHDGRPPVRVRLAMGDAYSDLGAQTEAREAYLAALESAQQGSTEMLQAYYGLLTSYDDDKFLGELQLTTCLEALEAFPFDAQLLLAMGSYVQAKGRLDLAARSFQMAVEHGQVDLGTWHLAELAEVAAACLGLVLQAQDKADQAQGVLEEALRVNHGSNRLRRHLIDLHVKHGRCNQALKVAELLAVPPEHREPLRNAIRGACRAAKEDWTPALAYLQSAYLVGCHDPICLRWLSVTLLSNGQIDAARPVLQQWRQVEPANVELQAYLKTIEQPPEDLPGVQEAVATADPGRRHLRVDRGADTSQPSPPVLPIITQASSADLAHPASESPPVQ